jgi:hypothetical protein
MVLLYSLRIPRWRQWWDLARMDPKWQARKSCDRESCDALSPWLRSSQPRHNGQLINSSTRAQAMSKYYRSSGAWWGDWWVIAKLKRDAVKIASLTVQCKILRLQWQLAWPKQTIFNQPMLLRSFKVSHLRTFTSQTMAISFPWTLSVTLFSE